MAPKVRTEFHRPEAVKKHSPHTADREESPAAWISPIALGLGLLGLVFKYKTFSWLGLLSCAAAIANLNSTSTDTKQIMCSFAFAIIGLFMNYFGRRP